MINRMARIILTRKSAGGGRSCFFRGKGGGRMTTTRGTTRQTSSNNKRQDGVKDIMNQTSTPSPNAPIAMMENKNTPSNYQVKQAKVNMDNFTKKLGTVKVSQPKTISFSL